MPERERVERLMSQWPGLRERVPTGGDAPPQPRALQILHAQAMDVMRCWPRRTLHTSLRGRWAIWNNMSDNQTNLPDWADEIAREMVVIDDRLDRLEAQARTASQGQSRLHVVDQMQAAASAEGEDEEDEGTLLIGTRELNMSRSELGSLVLAAWRDTPVDAPMQATETLPDGTRAFTDDYAPLLFHALAERYLEHHRMNEQARAKRAQRARW